LLASEQRQTGMSAKQPKSPMVSATSQVLPARTLPISGLAERTRAPDAAGQPAAQNGAPHDGTGR
jgi:hypothetical protein